MQTRRRNTNGVTATSGQSDKYREYHRIFEDPPDAESLLNIERRGPQHDVGRHNNEMRKLTHAGRLIVININDVHNA